MLSNEIGAQTNAAVTNGADIYCAMRNGGNPHETSWQAAYEVIKNKKQGLFKTSPKQAAAMITEEVVQEPERYDNCIAFIGDLFPTEKLFENNNDNPTSEQPVSTYEERENTETAKPNASPKKGEYIDRYSY